MCIRDRCWGWALRGSRTRWTGGGRFRGHRPAGNAWWRPTGRSGRRRSTTEAHCLNAGPACAAGPASRTAAPCAADTTPERAVTGTRTSQGQLCPDGLTGAGVPRTPTAAESPHKQQAATALVIGAGTAQVGRGATGVRDLADEAAALQQAQLDGRFGVPDRIGDQLTHHQFGDEGLLLHVPRIESRGDQLARSGHHGGIGRKVPGGDVLRVEGLGTGDEQGDVVGGVLGWHRGEHGVAKIVQGCRAAGEGTAQTRGPVVDVLLAGLDLASRSGQDPAARPSPNCPRAPASHPAATANPPPTPSARSASPTA